MTLKDQLQEKVTRWNKTLHGAIKDSEKSENGEIYDFARIKAEYKGRVYAARQFADMLGIEIDSRFPWEWFDENGNSIEPTYK